MVIELRQHEDLEHLLERSRTDPILIFKHSTQCSVSSAAYEEFLQFESEATEVPCGLVLVIENRRLSNVIEAELGVRHESPQAIVVENRRQTWYASHWSISADVLNQAIKKPAKG